MSSNDSLDKVVHALSLAINGKLDELEENDLQDSDVQDYLTRYFSESEVQPELTALLDIPFLLRDYLSLNIEERSQIASFHNRNPNYLTGSDEERIILEIKSKDHRKILQKLRWSRQLLEMFDFYLTNRIEGQIFSVNYLQRDVKLREKFRTMGSRVYENSKKNLSGGFKELTFIAAQRNSSLLDYTNFTGILRIDGPRQLLRIFNFYLEHRKIGQVFSTHYLQKDEDLKESFGNTGSNLLRGALENFDNGFDELVLLASEQDPRIKDYRDPSSVLKIDGSKHILHLFNFYLKNRKKGQLFSDHYIRSNEKLSDESRQIGASLLLRGESKLDSGFDELVLLASEQDPRILLYRDRAELLKIEGSDDLSKIFDFYLENKTEGQIFNTNYLRNDKLLAQSLGTIGRSIYTNARKHLGSSGEINCLVLLVAEKRPEILQHWVYNDPNKR